ncbi:MAG: site-specific DNA-methyltransferase, partial [bacterium]|nr:site-specific DNA-methyltransferase [bacterium]
MTDNTSYLDKAFAKDCLQGLQELPAKIADLVYLDPPFFTGKNHTLSGRDRATVFSFSDTWKSADEYATFLYPRLEQLHRVLKDTGTIFFHCDKNATHIARILLDHIFGQKHFRSEIIWSYKRWSNSKKGLLPCHQNIYWYSRTDNFKFNPIYTDYSESTNVDQILQLRKRDEAGKAIYCKDQKGDIIVHSDKKGVPMGDVWDIPFLNPKARERTGYPTQKPLLLLDRIIQLTTEKNDLVLDPFCGSGTTLVSASLGNRRYLGFDISKDAVLLAEKRLANPVRTESNLLKKGRESYLTADKNALLHLHGSRYVPVHRNKGIDAIIPGQFSTGPLTVRVQRDEETLEDAAFALFKASQKKK